MNHDKPEVLVLSVAPMETALITDHPASNLLQTKTVAHQKHV